MIKRTSEGGFTLIELLVVIAIIGILASVVLASLSSARDKGADAAIKSNLNSSRAQAELFYDSQSPRTYALVCTAAGGIATMLAGASDAAGGAGFVDCDSSATQWRMKARLVSNTGQYFCVDDSGKSSTVTAAWSQDALTRCP